MNKYEFDQDFVPYLDQVPVVIDFSSLEAVRSARAEREKLYVLGLDYRDDVSRSEIVIASSSDGSEVPLRVYRPSRGSTSSMPALIEIHGGGFIAGSLDMVEVLCQTVAIEAEAVVISVGYRLAPEHPYPAGLDDCYAALVWAEANAADLGIDTSRIAIAGQSAGAGLAAATALLARDRDGPAICHQWLEIPELDDRFITPSMIEFTDTPGWNRPNAEWSWKHYLGPLHEGDVPEYAAPARAVDLAGLPPTYLTVMQFDPLRDEGIDYAQRLLQAGVAVELHAYPGTFHGSSRIVEAEVSRRASRDSIDSIRRALNPSG